MQKLNAIAKIRRYFSAHWNCAKNI